MKRAEEAKAGRQRGRVTEQWAEVHSKFWNKVGSSGILQSQKTATGGEGGNFAHTATGWALISRLISRCACSLHLAASTPIALYSNTPGNAWHAGILLTRSALAAHCTLIHRMVHTPLRVHVRHASSLSGRSPLYYTYMQKHTGTRSHMLSHPHAAIHPECADSVNVSGLRAQLLLLYLNTHQNCQTGDTAARSAMCWYIRGSFNLKEKKISVFSLCSSCVPTQTFHRRKK